MPASTSSALLDRMRRSILVSGVLSLALLAGACSDDDDDDDGTGPSADCIDEIVFEGAFFTEDDVEAIDVGDSRSGTLSENDPEIQGWFYDLYAIDLDNGTVTITVDPAASLDADVALFYPDGTSEEEWYADSGFEGDEETLELSVDSGCYVIGVSSFEQGATGSYTISVD